MWAWWADTIRDPIDWLPAFGHAQYLRLWFRGRVRMTSGNESIRYSGAVSRAGCSFAAGLRREGGRVFVGLDYGHSGGGHGHPDRLNLLLSDDVVRWFDDPGTGSYVDESLHWYRSTLAHTAPLLDGHSQPRVHGTLLAFEDHGTAGWISAHATLASDCDVRRSVVVLNDYLVDRIEWSGNDDHEVARLTEHKSLHRFR